VSGVHFTRLHPLARAMVRGFVHQHPAGSGAPVGAGDVELFEVGRAGEPGGRPQVGAGGESGQAAVAPASGTCPAGAGPNRAAAIWASWSSRGSVGVPPQNCASSSINSASASASSGHAGARLITGGFTSSGGAEPRVQVGRGRAERAAHRRAGLRAAARRGWWALTGAVPSALEGVIGACRFGVCVRRGEQVPPPALRRGAPTSCPERPATWTPGLERPASATYCSARLPEPAPGDDAEPIRPHRALVRFVIGSGP